MPELRTSTMTHIVWCPPEWRAKARATLAGLLERHPARTIFLDPEPGGEAAIEARAELKDFQLQGMSREVLSEVIELRLRGSAARHPGLDRAAAARLRPARVLPLARRAGVGEQRARARSSASPTGSSSTRRNGVAFPARTRGSRRCSTASPSRTSRSRGRFPGAAASPSSGPRSAPIEKLRVKGPRADAELVAGWLRSRLKRDVVADPPRRRRRSTAMWVDGEPVASPGEPLEPERAALGRARPVRPRPGVRGRGARRRAAFRVTGGLSSRLSLGRALRLDEGSAAAVRLARPEPNVVMRPLRRPRRRSGPGSRHRPRRRAPRRRGSQRRLPSARDGGRRRGRRRPGDDRGARRDGAASPARLSGGGRRRRRRPARPGSTRGRARQAGRDRRACPGARRRAVGRPRPPRLRPAARAVRRRARARRPGRSARRSGAGACDPATRPRLRRAALRQPPLAHRRHDRGADAGDVALVDVVAEAERVGARERAPERRPPPSRRSRSPPSSRARR